MDIRDFFDQIDFLSNSAHRVKDKSTPNRNGLI